MMNPENHLTINIQNSPENLEFWTIGLMAVTIILIDSHQGAVGKGDTIWQEQYNSTTVQREDMKLVVTAYFAAKKVRKNV